MADRVRRFVATVNVPGYLPMDDEPPVFDTPQEAWTYLRDERERGEDDAEEEGDDYSETHAVLTALAAEDAVWRPLSMGLCPDGTGTIYGPTPGYDGNHDLGLAYTVGLHFDETGADDV